MRNTAAFCVVLARAFGLSAAARAPSSWRYPRRLAVRLPLVTVAAIALPFLLQSPAYVLSTSTRVGSTSRADDRQVLPLPIAYRDLRLLLRVGGMPIERSTYLYLQLGRRGLVLGAGVAERAAGSAMTRPALLLTLCTIWMTAFGPSDEACTYILLAHLAQAVLRPGRRRAAWQRAAPALASSVYPQIPLPARGRHDRQRRGQCGWDTVCRRHWGRVITAPRLRWLD